VTEVCEKCSLIGTSMFEHNTSFYTSFSRQAIRLALTTWLTYTRNSSEFNDEPTDTMWY